MKRFCWLASSGVLIFLTSIYGGCGEKNNKLSGGQQAAGRSGRIPITALIVQPQPLENKILTTGTLMANEEVELRPEVSGRITGVFFREGSPVKKGDLLLRINDRELKAQLDRKDIEEKLAADEEARKRSLYDIKGISQEEYDRALNALQMVRAEKEVIQSQLAETEIVAPFDGIIGLRYVSQGSYITANMLAASMQDIDPMKIEFSVPEKYARLIKNGTPIMARVGDSESEYTGQVYAVESKIDLGTRTIKARAKIPNPSQALIPGSFAKVEITLERILRAIVVPSGAVIPEIDGEKVFICRDGKARSVPVKTGIHTESGIQIVEGLNPQDTLIVTGLLQLTDGKPVEIQDLTGG